MTTKLTPGKRYKMSVEVHYAIIIDEMLEFYYSDGNSRVRVRMNYSVLSDWMGKYQPTGSLVDLVKMYLHNMFNLTELLS